MNTDQIALGDARPAQSDREASNSGWDAVPLRASGHDELLRPTILDLGQNHVQESHPQGRNVSAFPRITARPGARRLMNATRGCSEGAERRTGMNGRLLHGEPVAAALDPSRVRDERMARVAATQDTAERVRDSHQFRPGRGAAPLRASGTSCCCAFPAIANAMAGHPQGRADH